MLAQEFANAKQAKKAEALYKKLAEDSPSAESYRGLFRLYKDEGAAGMTRVLGMLDKVIDKATSDEIPASQGTVQHARAMVGALREDGELAQGLVEAAFKQRAEKELKFDTVHFLAILADRFRKTRKPSGSIAVHATKCRLKNEAICMADCCACSARRTRTGVEVCWRA